MVKRLLFVREWDYESDVTVCHVRNGYVSQVCTYTEVSIIMTLEFVGIYEKCWNLL